MFEEIAPEYDYTVSHKVVCVSVRVIRLVEPAFVTYIFVFVGGFSDGHVVGFL